MTNSGFEMDLKTKIIRHPELFGKNLFLSPFIFVKKHFVSSKDVLPGTLQSEYLNDVV